MKPVALVTGASGPLGLAVCGKLAADFRMLGVSRQAERMRAAYPQYRWLDWHELRSEENVDAVVHLAAAVSFGSTSAEVEDAAAVNIGLTLELLHSPMAQAARRLVYASTVAVYAKADDEVNEAGAIGPESAYACSKYIAELAVRACPVPSCVLRLAGIYGVGGRSAPVLNRFIEQARAGEAITVTEPASVRDFLYLQDAAEAVACAARAEANGIFNVATGNPQTLHAMAATVAGHFGTPVVVADTGVRTIRTYSTRAAQEALGFRARYDLTAALAEMTSAAMHQHTTA